MVNNLIPRKHRAQVDTANGPTIARASSTTSTESAAHAKCRCPPLYVFEISPPTLRFLPNWSGLAVDCVHFRASLSAQSEQQTEMAVAPTGLTCLRPECKSRGVCRPTAARWVEPAANLAQLVPCRQQRGSLVRCTGRQRSPQTSNNNEKSIIY